MSLRYKYSLITSIACSAVVAVFWGANIAAVYPFVEIVFQGQTLHKWVDDQLETVDQALGEAPAAPVPAAAGPARGDGRAKAPPLARDTLLKKQRTLQRAKQWIERLAPHTPFETLVAIVTFLLVGTLLKSIFRVVSLLLVTRVAERTTADLRNDFFRSLLSDQSSLGRPAGDAATRVGGDIGAIGGAIHVLFGRSIQEPLKMAACLAGAAYVNWRLLIFSMLACPLASFLLLALAKSIRRASLRAFDQKCLLMGRMLQTFQGLPVVKAYNMESHERRRFWQHTQKVYQEQMKITWYEGLIRSNNELLGIGIMCLSILAGGYLVLNQETHMLGIPLAAGPMDLGQIIVFYGFLIGCTDPLRKSGDVYGTLQHGIAAAERIMPFLMTTQIPVDAGKLRIRDARRRLVFDNVSFHYVPSHPVLQHVSFCVEPGETLAIIGANGCGKSTLINLLLRFYDPIEGRILLGDRDLLDVRRKNLRRRIALVTQKAVLFNDTVLQHRLRYASAQRSAGHRRRQTGPCARVHHDTVGQRLSDQRRRWGQSTFRRTATADRAGAGDPARPGHFDFGRGVQPDRPDESGTDYRIAQAVRPESHDADGDASDVDAGDGRSHPIDGHRADYRPGYPRRTDVPL
jgi:ATP-binding cassette subfamily B protein/subfamily B ATP-binding cassette protein MsbA